MPPAYTQADRLIQVNSPLPKDTLLALSLHGTEGLSQLYRFTVEVMAVRTAAVPFDALVGQPFCVALQLPKNQFRYFHGLCSQLVQGHSDNDFTYYQLEMVPKVWLLTKKTQSRIFQQMSVPDILKKKVFDGYDMDFQLHGTFEPRDFCVQYRETDFNFACRLMEEEGIYYYFKHAAGKHTMVVANTPEGHAPVPGETSVLYRTPDAAAAGVEDYIHSVVKVQGQTAGKFTLRDHTFELVQGTHDPNEAAKPITDSVAVGKVTHKLRLGNAGLDVYDWPGEYAQRFDGMDAGGSPAPKEVPKISPDGKRTVELRMQAEAATAVRIQGGGYARQLVAGHAFALKALATDPRVTPLKGDDEYVLTSVQHNATVGAGNYLGSSQADTAYTNTFTAIPSVLPFRPQRTTPKPIVPGSQSAQVVGPAGQEIFTDKYGRIKVHFHWDRDKDPRASDSSCWVRVAQLSAGRQWGSFSLPRVGQEVIIDFLEGDPDQPICVGCVYNVDQKPKYEFPEHKTRTYIRTNSSPGGVGYNEVRFEDKAGQEQIYVHSQRNTDERVRNDSFERVGNNRHLRVGFYLPNDHKGDLGGETKKGSQFEEVAVDQHLKVWKDKQEHVGGDFKLLVGGGDGDGNLDVHVKAAKKELIDGTADLHVKGAVKEKLDATLDQHVTGAVKQLYDASADVHVKGKLTETVGGGADLTVTGDQREKVDGTVSLTAGKDVQEKVGGNHALDAGMNVHIKAGMNLILEAGMKLSLKVGGNFVDISPAGVAIQGTMVLINSGGAAGAGAGANPAKPTAAKDAADAADAADAKPSKPTDADASQTGAKSN